MAKRWYVLHVFSGSVKKVAQSIREQSIPHGLEAQIFRDETSARESLSTCLNEGRYPLLLTPADTSGEKLMEIFVAEDESTTDIDLQGFLGIEARLEEEGLQELLRMVNAACSGGDRPSMDTLIGAIATCVPALSHAKGKSLDDRM